MSLTIEEEWLWCDTCKKTARAIFIRISEDIWIMFNPHEHPLRMGICPKTMWYVRDYKEKVSEG